MHLVVRANDEQRAEVLKKGIPENFRLSWFSPTDLIEEAEGDVFFDFCYDSEHTSGNIFVKGRIVFANAVITATHEFKHKNYLRFNGWSGFFENEKLEIACTDEQVKQWAEEALNLLGWKYTWSPDEPGMTAPRVVSMIINEAYFGLEEGISTEAEIDVAMKLGTGYPYGPFEWAKKTGVSKMYHLLKKLSITDARYTPAPLLEKIAMS